MNLLCCLPLTLRTLQFKLGFWGLNIFTVPSALLGMPRRWTWTTSIRQKSALRLACNLTHGHTDTHTQILCSQGTQLVRFFPPGFDTIKNSIRMPVDLDWCNFVYCSWQPHLPSSFDFESSSESTMVFGSTVFGFGLGWFVLGSFGPDWPWSPSPSSFLFFEFVTHSAL